MPGVHTAKEKRQAKHIEASEEASGKSEKRAKSIAWATVNALRSSKGHKKNKYRKGKSE